MTPLSDDLQAFLEAERDIDVPAASERERIFARLEPLLVIPVAVAAAAAASSASVATSTAAGTVAVTEGAGSAILGGALKLKIAAGVVSAALLGGALGATGHAYLAASAAHPVATLVASPHTAQRTPDAVDPIPVELAIPAVPPSAASSTAAAAPSFTTPRPERPRPAGSLRAERLLIEAASAALMRGDSESAIVALQKHARTFPNGDLAEEREVLLAKARASRGGSAPRGPSNEGRP